MQNQKQVKHTFTGLFWLVILFEFFERGSYYGMMSVLSVYLTDILNISKENVGLIKGTIQPILYFLPILSGAVADRFGFRKTLTSAFIIMGGGYFLTAQVTAYTPVFLTLCFMALGAGIFKPIISGTIASVTPKEQSALGFGIYYWSINLGAFLFPLFLIPYLKTIPSSPPWKWVMLAAALGTGLMVIPTLLFFKEPPKFESNIKKTSSNLIQTLANAFEIIYSPFILIFSVCRQYRRIKIILYSCTLMVTILSIWFYAAFGNFLLLFAIILFWLSQLIMSMKHHSSISAIFVLLMLGFFWWLPGLTSFSRIICTVIGSTVFSIFMIDIREEKKFKDHFRFLLMIFIYSGFWVLYFQMYDSVLWYVKDYVDASSLNGFVNGILHGIGIHYVWFFDVEHVTVINAGTIILLQLLVSSIVKNTKALPTMIVGIILGTLGMAILAINTSIWIFIAGIIILSLGEMTAHPKFISYVGQTAPKERLATYMGYVFLYGVIGSSIGAPLGARLYVHFVDNLHEPKMLWLVFSGIGILTIIGLIWFNWFTKRSEKGQV